MLFGGNLVNQPAYQNTKYRLIDSLSNSDLVMNNLFWVGVYPGIDNGQIKHMADKFGDFFRS